MVSEYSDRMPALPVECGYDSVTVELYKQDHGGQSPPANFYDTGWKLWRAGKLNDFYRRVRDSVKTLDENLFVASSPSVYPWAYDQYLQDSKTWVNTGIVDQFLPQLYRYSIADYIYELNSSLSYINPEKKDITFAGVLMNVGSYTIEPQFLLQSLQANRNAGVKGEGHFFYEGLRRNNFRLADTLRSTYYTQPVDMPGREFNRRPKGLLVSEDSTNVVKTGSWENLPVPGFRGGIIRTGSSTPSSLEYSYDIPADGFYNLYAYLIPSFSFAPEVKYTIKTKQGDTVVSVNQQSPGKQGWFHLGSYEMMKGKRTVFTLNNNGIPAGKYVMSDAGLLLIDRKKSPNVVVSSRENVVATTLPTKFEVSNNFPNPFNPETMVTFKLSEAGQVNIIIYNQLGELIEHRTLGELAVGEHQFRWNAERLPSGPYFIKVESGVNSVVLKTLLLK
ncbi:MAG: family 10 glycosylhydrolase [Ignavibacteriales bacterium]|nr:family 10 glycosylhydrolase [Ignavibacteriales bacterium]